MKKNCTHVEMRGPCGPRLQLEFNVIRCEMPTILICLGSVRTPQKRMRVKLAPRQVGKRWFKQPLPCWQSWQLSYWNLNNCILASPAEISESDKSVTFKLFHMISRNSTSQTERCCKPCVMESHSIVVWRLIGKSIVFLPLLREKIHSTWYHRVSRLGMFKFSFVIAQREGC